jgi:hypothetical protein
MTQQDQTQLAKTLWNIAEIVDVEEEISNPTKVQQSS